MKKNLHFYLILIALICNCHFAFSQQISINDNVSIQQLIEDNLVEGHYAERLWAQILSGTDERYAQFIDERVIPHVSGMTTCKMRSGMLMISKGADIF